MASLSPADTIEQYLDELFAYADVTGVAEGEHESRPCIKIYLAQDNELTRLELPEELNGYRVVVEVTGSFNKL